MFRKKYFILGLAAIIVMATAMPALAVSSITNTFSASDYSINTGQSINFNTQTVYGWIVLPTPYPSNFVTEVSGYHFNKPSTFASGGLPNSNNWIYDSTPIFISSPAYRYASGKLWIIPTQSKYLKFSATAKSASGGSRRSHRHGQSIELNWDISYGSPAWIYTTHN